MLPPYDELAARLRESEAELAAAKAENAWLRKQLFGPGKSEKLDRLQVNLPLEGVAEKPIPAKIQKVSYERLAAPREKRPVPAEAFKNVPVKETIVIEPDEVKADPEAYERIGEERTFEVDIVPPQILKREIVRPTYRHKTNRALPPIVATAPERPVVGGYASAGLLAWIALSKYVDHVPLYRLEKQSARWGAEIPRQTMADWIRITAEWLEPIYRRMHKRLLEGPYESYAREHPEITWVGCWAHARRKFFEAERENPKAVRLILLIIGWLYECEALWDENKLTASNRKRHRKKHYTRKLYWLKKIALGLRQRVLPKSGLGKACDYLLKYWEPLTRHLEHGETRLDNNLVENAIRPSAIGKKNWLFVGHPGAGQRSAIIYSIVISCQRRGIDPLAYLRDVLSRLPQMTTRDDLSPLLPANWQHVA